MSESSTVLLLSGSLRAGSSNNAVLRTAHAAAPAGVRTVLYDGLAELPHFNPDDDTDAPPAPVTALRAAIADADAVLICTPEYAGTLPGSFKNLLDWTVGTADINDKPAAWVNAANPGRGQGAEAALRSVLEYTGARIVGPACVRIAAGGRERDAEGRIADPEVREQLAKVLTLLVEA